MLWFWKDWVPHQTATFTLYRGIFNINVSETDYAYLRSQDALCVHLYGKHGWWMNCPSAWLTNSLRAGSGMAAHFGINILSVIKRFHFGGNILTSIFFLKRRHGKKRQPIFVTATDRSACPQWQWWDLGERSDPDRKQVLFITLRAKLSGAVYCNRSCLWVCLCVCLCLYVRYHDYSKLRASILTKLGL